MHEVKYTVTYLHYLQSIHWRLSVKCHASHLLSLEETATLHLRQ
jgi:hypothetical protein